MDRRFEVEVSITISEVVKPPDKPLYAAPARRLHNSTATPRTNGNCVPQQFVSLQPTTPYEGKAP